MTETELNVDLELDIDRPRREDPAALEDLRDALSEAAACVRDAQAIRERVWNDRDRTADELVRLRGERAGLIDAVVEHVARHGDIRDDYSRGWMDAAEFVLRHLGEWHTDGDEDEDEGGVA